MGQNPIQTVPGVFTPAGGVAFGKGDNSGTPWSAARYPADYTAANLQLTGMAANQAGATLSAGLATTYVGLCLSNPAASGKNLVLQNAGININVATAGALALGLITGYAAGGITVHTTPMVVQSSFVGLANPLVGLVDAACTLVGTPLWSRWLLEISTGVGAGAFPINGQIIVPPGGYVAVGGSVAGSTAGLLASFVWTEEPIGE